MEIINNQPVHTSAMSMTVRICKRERASIASSRNSVADRYSAPMMRACSGGTGHGKARWISSGQKKPKQPTQAVKPITTRQ